MLNRAPRQVKFLSATVHPTYAAHPSQRTVSVRLERSGEQIVGRSGGDGQSGADVQRAGEAMLDALGKVVGKEVSLVLRDVAPVIALKQSFVLAIVEVRQGRDTTTLLGACRSSLNPARDGALAVLDALNRSLGTG